VPGVILYFFLNAAGIVTLPFELTFAVIIIYKCRVSFVLFQFCLLSVV
jgi:hypothetical protein